MTVLSPGAKVDTYELNSGDMYFIPRAYPHHIDMRLGSGAGSASIVEIHGKQDQGDTAEGRDAGEGNIKGEAHIYHKPGDRDYDRVVMKNCDHGMCANGKRWFCTEDEARAAGWRPARG
jgi:hypothetical protein